MLAQLLGQRIGPGRQPFQGMTGTWVLINSSGPSWEGLYMRRTIAVFAFLLASVATASAQGLAPAVWQSQRGGVLKMLSIDPAGNFTGVFISSATGPCPGVPYNVIGSVRGPRVVFQSSRNWTSDCNVTTNWSGRFVSPTTIVARGSALVA